MANHSYVDGPKLSKKAALQTLENAVKSVLGDQLEIVELSDTTKCVHWVVHLPNSAIEDRAAAGRISKASGEAYGFLVQYHCDGAWEFRHPYNQWERWAQDKIQQVIAQVLGVTTYRDDSTDEPIKVDPTEELEATWQTAPRIDPKWWNVGSRWIHLEQLFSDRTLASLVAKSWAWVERHSYEVIEVDDFAQVKLTNTLLGGKGVVWSQDTRVHGLVHGYVRLWNEPFPTEATPYRLSAIKPLKPKIELERVSALDQILQDDD